MRGSRWGSFLLVVAVGAAAGAAFGDSILPPGESGWGEVVSDAVFAVGGAFLFGVLHEVVSDIRS